MAAYDTILPYVKPRYAMNADEYLLYEMEVKILHSKRWKALLKKIRNDEIKQILKGWKMLFPEETEELVKERKENLKGYKPLKNISPFPIRLQPVGWFRYYESSFAFGHMLDTIALLNECTIDFDFYFYALMDDDRVVKKVLIHELLHALFFVNNIHTKPMNYILMNEELEAKHDNYFQQCMKFLGYPDDGEEVWVLVRKDKKKKRGKRNE
jgi:hypothetical protein